MWHHPVVYAIALTVAACLRAGTRADVAWLVAATGLPVPDWSAAIVLTPGGGRTGTLLGGALDGPLAERAGRASTGRLVGIEIGEIDALIAGLPVGGSARCLLIPADVMPAAVWDLAAARQPLCLVSRLDGDEVVDVELLTTEDIAREDEGARDLFAGRSSGSTVGDDRVVSVFWAVPQLVIVGDGPVAPALERAAALIGWQTRLVTDSDTARGVIAGLSSIDKVVVTGHDLDLTGAGLIAALDTDVGYIGALGSRRLHENRADWLAYRGVTDLARVNAPAGLDIGADTPATIAVSILAEAIAAGAGGTNPTAPS
jgi:xanthine dehydrogenase accessory factor